MVTNGAFHETCGQFFLIQVAFGAARPFRNWLFLTEMHSLELPLMGGSSAPRPAFWSKPVKMATGLLALMATSIGGWAAGTRMSKVDAAGGAGGGGFVPKEGLGAVLVMPGPPGPLAVLPMRSNKKPPSCIFSYQSADHGLLFGAASKKAGVLYGARYDGGQHAYPTGDKHDVLRGEVFCFDEVGFPDKLWTVDNFKGYNPASPAKGLAKRNVVHVVGQDGTSTDAFWYYQMGPSAMVTESLLRAGVAKLRYFDTKGAAEVARFLLAAGGADYVDVRYKFGFKDGKPSVEEQHDKDKQAGLFDPNLKRLPVLTLADGRTIGQSRAIERFVARDLGLMGANEVEAAQIDAYCEHLRDVRDAWNKARGSPFAPPNEETIKAKEKWYNEDLPGWMSKLEVVTPAGGHVMGGVLSYADILLFHTLTDFFDDTEKSRMAYGRYPHVTSVVDQVGQLETIKKWLASRPPAKF
eukprot:g79363.t1